MPPKSDIDRCAPRTKWHAISKRYSGLPMHQHKLSPNNRSHIAQTQCIPMHARASGPDTVQGNASECWRIAQAAIRKCANNQASTNVNTNSVMIINQIAVHASQNTAHTDAATCYGPDTVQGNASECWWMIHSWVCVMSKCNGWQLCQHADIIAIHHPCAPKWHASSARDSGLHMHHHIPLLMTAPKSSACRHITANSDASTC